MKFAQLLLPVLLLISVPACSKSPESITSSSSGEVINELKARATGGGAAFDGQMDRKSDLDDLVSTAWGNGRLGLHRGHAPIESVLEEFLGISHDEMHIFMEESDLNLAGICKRLGFDPENLVDTLTNSFEPYIDEAVSINLISEGESGVWIEKVREQFRRRVYWQGGR